MVNCLYENNLLSEMQPVVEKMADIIDQSMGVRIGQSTVFSQKMHTFQPEKAEEVNILQDIDAGQSFYNRPEKGEIYHLDIFHQCGLVDHRQVAAKLCQAVEVYNMHYCTENDIVDNNDDNVKAHFIDIQTGTGGGRITGNLDYGKKVSLQKGHINHVHIAMMMPKKHLAWVVYAIMAVEDAILSSNLELRCNEKIKNVKGVSKSKVDLSAYADKSDSLLQTDNNNSIQEQRPKKKDKLDSMDHNDEAQELKNFEGRKDSSKNAPKPNGGVNSCRGADGLLGKGTIELNAIHIGKSKESIDSKSDLEKQLPEIEAHLKQVVHKAKFIFQESGKSRKMQNKISLRGGHNLVNKSNAENECGELAISETIYAVARRMVENKENIFKINWDDLKYFANHKRKKIEFCLLIDASSSMEGQRIRAAKRLARYLLSTTYDRISVIVFQQNKAWVQVPFTRDGKQIEQSLEEIKACGETPLALGLTACLEYIEQAKACNPLIILITDGVPTLGTTTSDPVYDALQIGKRIKLKKYGFTCIGLKPHLDYLKQLSEVTGGSIYAVDELEKVGMC